MNWKKLKKIIIAIFLAGLVLIIVLSGIIIGIELNIKGFIEIPGFGVIIWTKTGILLFLVILFFKICLI